MAAIDWDKVADKVRADADLLWRHLRLVEAIDREAAANFVKLTSGTPIWAMGEEYKRAVLRMIERRNRDEAA